jgi:hypothetical protein
VGVQLTAPKVLVVEGRDEELFFGALLGHLGLLDVQILPVGGKTLLASNLRALAASLTFYDVTALGIARDADNDAAAAFQSVCSALRHAGLPVPTAPATVVAGPPAVSAFILPGEGQIGMLEDLCLQSVTEHGLTPCLDDYFQCVSQVTIPPRNLAKGRVQAFLAAMPEPGKRLGEAAQAGYWLWDNPAFEALKAFLRSL